MKIFQLAKSIWEIMDGKKTETGKLLALLGLVLVYFNVGAEQSEIIMKFAQALVDSGLIAILIGLIHKWLKQRSQAPVPADPEK